MKSFRIILYNTHLFWKSVAATFKPDLVYKDSVRLSSFIEHCKNADYDVVGLTEVWSHSVQNQLKEMFAAYKMNSFAFQGESAVKGSSGLFLAFKGQVDGNMSFDYYEGLVGPDAMSAKGIAHGVLNLNGTRIYVVQTHTQASYVGTEQRDDAARKKQIESILFPIIDMAVQNYPDLPIFLLGDLNITAGSDQYEWFAKRLGFCGMSDTWVEVNGRETGITYDPNQNVLVKHFDPKQDIAQRLDYIFYIKKKLEAESMRVIKWKTSDGLDLSDHYGVEGIFG